jgi:chromosomal replication initiator protein
MTFAPEVWDGVLRRLESELPSFSYEAWLAPLTAEVREGGLLLVCPSTFHRDRIQRQFLPHITRCLTAESGQSAALELRVAEPSPALPERVRTISTPPHRGRASASGPAGAGPAPRADAPARGASVHPIGRRSGKAAANTARRSPTSQQESFDNFVVGPCNALAREASLAIARDDQRTLNQLYLAAEPGMGKTHLSRAVAREAACQGAESVRFVGAEPFTNEFLAALRGGRIETFKRRYRDRCRLLVIDDIQFLAKKDATQLEFFHTVQHVIDAGGRVVLTGDRMPHELQTLPERIRAQLAAGFVAELRAPDAEVRREILRSKAANGGVRLPEECLELLVEAVSGSVRNVESVLIQLVTSASLLKRPIDADLTRQAIAQKAPRPEPTRTRLDVPSVITAVARFFQTTPEKLAARSRARSVLLPRQIAMYLCDRYTGAPLSEIGRALGRSHPSVRNGIEKIERDILERPKLRYQIEAITQRLGGES